MRRLTGRLARTAGALGLAAAALATVPAAPASAGTSATAGCTRFFATANIQVQVDNCSDGWVWVYTGSGTYFKATVYVTDSFGHQQPVLTADQGKTNAKQYIQISSFHYCGTKYLSWAPPTWWTSCTDEIYL